MPVVRNLTPFELMTSPERYGAPVYDVAPFATATVPERGSDRIYVQRRGGDLEYPVGMVWTSAPDQAVSITVDQLRSNFDPGRAFSRTRTFENRTSSWVDISTGAEDSSRRATLGPGDRYINDFPTAHVWIVRSAFSNEVVSAFIDDDDPAHREISYTITDDYREQLAQHAPLPSPLPGNHPVVLIGGKRETPPPEDRAYISIEDRDGALREEFNGRANVVPRRVKVLGAKLIWDANDDNYGLMSLQGQELLDLESLEMIADEVIIRSHLRMPGTNVLITARRLEFAYDGMVDTSPPPLPERDLSGPEKPPKVDEKYEAKDGTDGLSGGSVTLVAHTLVTGGTDKTRIRTRGGPGGAAEPGGLLAYRRRDTHMPNTVAPEISADCPCVKESDIAGKFTVFGSVTGAGAIDGWQWPGDEGAPRASGMPPREARYKGARLALDDSDNNRVTSLLISAHDRRWYGPLDCNWFWFPEGGHYQQNGGFDTKRFTEHRSVPPRLVPGDGADAYPGGRPGDGGAAGVVFAPAELRDVVAQVADVRAGDAGPTTPAKDGAPPGKPAPRKDATVASAVALLVDMAIRRNTPDVRENEPRMWVDEYRALPGKPSDPISANPGSSGEVRSGGGSWLSVEVIDAVLAFARTAFRDGHREQARRAIEPYYVLLRSPLLARRPQYIAPIIELSAMRENLMANVDYYGNPPGWLPRLRVSSNLALFDTVRKASYQLLYFATTTEEKFDDLKHRRTLAGEVRGALQNETTACRKVIAEATDNLAEARLELAKIANELGAQQQALDKLKTYAEQEALSAAEKQRIYKGVMQVVGGAMQAVPVGQPYLGAGGDLVSAVGEVDFFTSDKPFDQAAKVLETIGTATDSFLEDNTDLLAADMTKKLQREVKLGKKDVTSLEEQIKQANGEAGQLEKDVGAYTEPIVNKRLAELEARRGPLQVKQTVVEAAIAEFQSGEPIEEVKAEQVETIVRPKMPKEASLERELLDLTKSLGDVDKEIEEAKKLGGQADKKRLVRLRLSKVALTDAKVRAEALKQQKDQADAKIAEAEAKATDKQERRVEYMGRLKNMGKGITGIGAGISTLGTPVSKDDEAVQTLAASLLKTKDPQQYQQVIKDMEDLANRQRAAMEKLSTAQSIINSNVARMAENMAAQNNLGRQLHTLDNTLDVRAKQYLRGMRLRAEEMLHSSMYHLVMSFRYEYLKDLPDSFVNSDRIAAALKKLDRAAPDADTAQSGKPKEQPKTLLEAVEGISIDMTKPKEEDLKKIDELVREFEFLKLGVDIATERQHRAGSVTNTAKLALRSDQLQQLSRLRTITFNLVEDFNLGGDYSWADARIAKITLKEVDLKTSDRIVNMRIEFRHSGESIINAPTASGDPVYYYFRAAATDDPVAWTFATTRTATPGAEPAVEMTIKADTKVEVEELLKDALKSEDIKFEEYWPSLFSEITLNVELLGRARVEAIPDLVFEVEYAMKQVKQSRGIKRVSRLRDAPGTVADQTPAVGERPVELVDAQLPKKEPVENPPAKEGTVKEVAAKKGTAKKAAPKKLPAKKARATTASAKKAAVKKLPAKKAASTKATAKKASAKHATPEEGPGKKAPAKKATRQ